MIIEDRLAFASDCVRILRELRSKVKEPQDITKDYILRGAIERYLHLALEAIIDVGMRLTSILGLTKPERYRDIARVFRDCGVLGDDEAKRLELWIGLRNILVHGYARIDYGKIYEVLNEVDELKYFVEKIYEYVRSRGIDPQDEVSREVMGKVRDVLGRYGDVVFAYIFGSYATGKRREGSDVDIAIYTRRSMGWREYIRLIFELEDKLGVSVDVVDLRTAPLLLAYEVITKGIVVIDRNREERVNFETKILKEFLDLKPRLERHYSKIISRQ